MSYCASLCCTKQNISYPSNDSSLHSFIFDQKCLLEARLNDFVGLKGSNEYIEDPEEDKDSRCDCLDVLWTTKFSSHSRIATDKEDRNGKQSFDTEDSDREAQAVKKYM